MPRSAEIAGGPEGSVARELLEFYDELTELNACSAFVTQALAAALLKGGGLGERSSTGAGFCAQWLNDRTAGLEQEVKKIQARAGVHEKT